MLYHAKGTISYYQRSLPYAAGVSNFFQGLWCPKSLSGSGGSTLVGVQGAKPQEDLEILHFEVPG